MLMELMLNFWHNEKE